MPVAARNVPAETRERILAATWKLMEKSRDLQVRIADIAAAAGVSRQAVYLHFGNRANLLLAAVQYRDRISPVQNIARAAEEDAVPGALANFVAAWFEHIPRIEPVAHLLSAASQTDPEAKVAWEDRMSLLRRAYRRSDEAAGRGACPQVRVDGRARRGLDLAPHPSRRLATSRRRTGLGCRRVWRRVCASLERDLLKTDK